MPTSPLAPSTNSVKFANVGDHVIGRVIDATEVQQMVFNTRVPDFWPDGNPKMQIVVKLACPRTHPRPRNERSTFPANKCAKKFGVP